MKPPIRKRLPLCLAGAMLLGAGLCEGISACITGGQIHQQAAERWRGESETPYTQISVFFKPDAMRSAESFSDMEQQLSKALTEASLETSGKDARLWYDAWSAEQGTVTAKGKKQQEVKAAATAVGGDFFQIHSMRLMSGSYITSDDLMQDRVVIDTMTAWLAFGSSDVAGMELTVDGVPYQIAGVVEPEEDKITQKAYGELPRIYMPFARRSADEGEGMYQSRSDEVRCYEAVLPDPVRGFAEKTLRKELGDEDSMQLVVNTRRGSIARRWSTMRHLRDMVIAEDGIAYPWWENAARMRDFSAAEMLRLECLLLVFPILCLLALIWKGYKHLESFLARKREEHKRKYRTIGKDPYSV